MSETDALYDASDESIALKLLRFKPRIQEDPIERAMMGLICAVEDLDGVMLLARTPESLAEIRTTAEDAIRRLIILTSVALTLETFTDGQQ